MQDRIAIVTGASRGIGRAIALELSRQGCHVLVNYNRNAEAADEVVQAIVANGGKAIAVGADVTSVDDAKALADACLEAYGTIDILVNNAGIARDALLMRMSESDWDVVLDTNLKGAFNCIKAVQRTMLRKHQGCIINIGSVSGLIGNAGQANYSAAKAGLVGLTKSVARELASRSIRVNLVAPGFVDTDMTAEMPDGLLEGMRERIPLGRIGSPIDIAGAVAFLASDAASYITGQVLCVDGGLAM